jgi:hypothetical protein
MARQPVLCKLLGRVFMLPGAGRPKLSGTPRAGTMGTAKQTMRERARGGKGDGNV